MSANCRFQRAFYLHHQRLPAPDIHEEDEDHGGGQLDQGDGDEAGEKFEMKLVVEGHVLPDIGVLSEVDLVSAERRRREVEKRERENILLVKT